MNYRIVEVMANQTFGVAGTHIQPIRTQDPISALHFHLGTTVTAGPHLDHLLAAFTRIEIRDGSDIIMSLSGTQMGAVGFYDTNKLASYMVYTSYAGVHDAEVSILFGRWIGDELLALDPKRFDNLQIQITYNAALHSTTCTNTQIEIHAEVFDEKVISPVGFLQVREFERHVPATLTVHPIEMPTDLAIRKLLVQSPNVNIDIANNLGRTRLDEDNDKRVVYDLSQLRWEAFNLKWFPLCVQRFLMVVQQGPGNPFFAAPSAAGMVSVTNASGVLAWQAGAAVAGRYAVITASNTDLLYGHVTGHHPYGVMCMPFGKQDNIDDWYDVTKVGDLRFRVWGGTAVGATPLLNTILQQLRRY